MFDPNLPFNDLPPITSLEVESAQLAKLAANYGKSSYGTYLKGLLR